MNYRNLSAEHQNKLEVLCKVLFIHYKGIRIKTDGNIVFIRKYWSFQKSLQIPLIHLLFQHIPEMLSVRRFGNYDVFDYYITAIHSLIDQNYTDNLGGISKVIDYLYVQAYELNRILNVQGAYGSTIKIPHPDSFYNPSNKGVFSIRVETPTFTDKIIEEDHPGAVAYFFDWVRSCTLPKKLQLATVALFVTLNVNYPITNTVMKVLRLANLNYGYYFDST